MDWRIWIGQPVIWIIPGVGLALIAFINVADLLLNFVPPPLNNALMAVASALVSSMSAGFILELLKGRGKLTYYTVAGTWVIGLITYLAGHGFLERNLVEGAQMASVPFVGAILAGVCLTVIPGVFTGSVVGGVVSLIPDGALLVEEAKESVAALNRRLAWLREDVRKVRPGGALRLYFLLSLRLNAEEEAGTPDQVLQVLR